MRPLSRAKFGYDLIHNEPAGPERKLIFIKRKPGTVAVQPWNVVFIIGKFQAPLHAFGVDASIFIILRKISDLDIPDRRNARNVHDDLNQIRHINHFSAACLFKFVIIDKSMIQQGPFEDFFCWGALLLYEICKDKLIVI